MAKVSKENWVEQIRDPKIECMSREEMKALQSEKLVKQVKNVYDNVAFYNKKMKELGVEPGDIKGIEDIGKLPFTTKEDLMNLSTSLIGNFVTLSIISVGEGRSSSSK